MRPLLLLFLVLVADRVKAADPVLAPSGTLRTALAADATPQWLAATTLTAVELYSM
jgi:hypothetical protein